MSDGRYLARIPSGEGAADGDSQEVLVIQTLGAPRAAKRRRRARAAEKGPPGEVPVTRVTAVKATSFAGDGEASGWLEGLVADHDAMLDAAGDGLALLNKALAVLRAATGDPYIHELSGERALAIRIGYGSGEQVAEGEWSDARELEPGAPVRGGRRARREADIRPQERIASVLGGREQLDACETMLARARIDLDGGHTREAALQLQVGAEAMLVELRGALKDPGHDDDMETLRRRRGEIAAAAGAALRGELDPATVENVAELLAVAERVLRRRRILHG